MGDLRLALWIATHPLTVARVLRALHEQMLADYDLDGSCAGMEGNGQGMNQALGWVEQMLARRAPRLPRPTAFDDRPGGGVCNCLNPASPIVCDGCEVPR